MGARPQRIRAIRHFNTFRKQSSADERVEQTAADIELNPAKTQSRQTEQRNLAECIKPYLDVAGIWAGALNNGASLEISAENIYSLTCRFFQ